MRRFIWLMEFAGAALLLAVAFYTRRWWLVALALVLIWFGVQSRRGVSGASSRGNSARQTIWLITAWSVAWAWFFLAGIGGLVLLIHQGPSPITNGWFAMFSGIAACPLTALLLKNYAGVTVSGHLQFAVSLLIMVAGRIAVVVVLHRPFLPQ
jgi:hypothetical protein